VLRDIRVLRGARGRGVGRALFRAAEAWARGRGCRWLTIETDNTNVGACRFCARMGATLGGIDRFFDPDAPGETQLLWYFDLAAERVAEPPHDAPRPRRS
jgi:RimJ/RimL family protein N-acetyltransferase